jgi:hypothetical protein
LPPATKLMSEKAPQATFSNKQGETTMILGMSVPAFTLVHVIISLIAIVTGIVVTIGMLNGSKLAGWTGVFLLTTVLTSVTGFFFHSAKFGPPHVFGVISLVVLAATIAALYLFHLAGGWRRMYVIGSIFALYLNVFVLVVQSFQKIPFLNPLAPTQSTEPAFAGTQGVVLVLFVLAGIFATKRFHPVVSVASAPSPAAA